MSSICRNMWQYFCTAHANFPNPGCKHVTEEAKLLYYTITNYE